MCLRFGIRVEIRSTKRPMNIPIKNNANHHAASDQNRAEHRNIPRHCPVRACPFKPEETRAEKERRSWLLETSVMTGDDGQRLE